MDIEKYKVLMDTISIGSITRAAEQLGYTPSGISRLINNLEKENGFPLLIRTKSGIIPTEACKNLMPTIEHLLQSAENLNQLSAQICGIESGTITVGSSYTIYYQWLSRLIYKFNQKYPNINFTIVEGTSSTLSSMIENGQADFCIISKRKGYFNWIPLCQDELVVWVPENHHSIEKGYYKLEDLEKETFIQLYPGKETDNSMFLSHKNISPTINFATADVYAAYSMVEAGLGVSLTNKLLAENIKGNAAVVPLKPSQSIDIGIAIPEDNIISPATKTFVKFAKDFIDELG